MSQLTDDERRSLGLDARISRRDFVNGALVSAGAALLTPCLAGRADAGTDMFTGYGGVGDYAKANGNTGSVTEAGHRMRDGFYDEKAIAGAQRAGDFDLIVVGGGIAGLSAAYFFSKATGMEKRRVLILENHPMLGGQARQNEFILDGERLLGPQASNAFRLPEQGSGSVADAFFTEFSIPRQYEWQAWDRSLKPLRFVRDNTSNMDGFRETQFDIGYFFGKASAGEPLWRRNIWSDALKSTPYSEAARHDLLHWRADSTPLSEAEMRHLDTITYKQFLQQVRGYDPAVVRFIEPFVGDLCGVSTDALSARVGRQLVRPADTPMLYSFPGGNAPFARALLRGLLPDALPGRDSSSLMYGAAKFGALDVHTQATRIRLDATVLRVQHQGPGSGRPEVTYEKGGRLFKAGARSVVMASGGWINKHILVDMPDDLRAAYRQFSYAPALVVNVALRQWRFLYDLGVTSCRWIDDPDGFGWVCNIRQLMLSDGHAPPLHPDKPIVLTFYLGLPIPGLPAAEQGATARAKLLATPYRDIEVRIRRQMLRLFGAHGFKPERDIAGIVLNRWGHARLIQPPGFFYGVDGKPGPLERVRQGYGRIAIGHSELNGSQHWDSAVEYGKKAGERAAVML
jgi:spermidine dehydrogenase